MNDQIENEQINIADLKATLLSNAASTYAYNKINNILLMQILAKVENRDMEEIRNNVERYIAEFADEYIKMNAPNR
jgi:hypothetical protein